MSLPRLSLLVLLLATGTAWSVKAYLESREPLPLVPRLMVREPSAPEPELTPSADLGEGPSGPQGAPSRQASA